jgi:hypothetical protein
MPTPRRRKPAPPLRPDLMDALRHTGEHATEPKVPLPHTATAMQLLRAVGVLALGFTACAILAGLFLRLTLFVAGV